MARDMFGLLEFLKLEDVSDHGAEIGARCPMHEKRTGIRENRPDHWFLNKATGKHHCFSCGYKGELPRLVIDVTGGNIWESLRVIRQFGTGMESLFSDPNEEFEEAPPVVPLTAIQQFDPPPDRALRHRGITDASAAFYGLRWDLEESGWILPIVGPEGNLWGWQKKTVDTVENCPKRVKKSGTMFGIERWVGKRSIVMESPLDVPHLHSLSENWGTCALATFGSAISDTQLRLLRDLSTEVILALDNDLAGKKETRRIITAGWGKKTPMKVLNYSGISSKDPGEMDHGEFQWALANAIPTVFWSEY